MSSRSRSELDGLSLRSSLRELLEAPRVPTTHQVWKALSRYERARALWVLLSEAETSPAFIGRVVIAVERRFRLRRQTVLNKALPELCADASRCEATALPIEAALRELHLRDRRPLLSSFLNAAGIAHRGGVVAPDAIARETLTAEQVHHAVESLAGIFAADDIAIYLLTLLSLEANNWPAIDEWRASGALQLATSPKATGFPLTGAIQYPSAASEDLHSADEIAEGEATQEPDDAQDVEKSAANGKRELATNPMNHKLPYEVERPSGGSRTANVLARLASLGEEFHSLGGELRATADQLDAGIPPRVATLARAESVVRGFEVVRAEVGAIIGQPLPQDGEGGIATLRSLVERDFEERARAARQAALEPIRKSLQSVARLSGPPSVKEALVGPKAHAIRILAGFEAVDVDEDTINEHEQLRRGEHPLSALIAIVCDEEELDLEELNALAASVAAAYGEPLARAAVRRKLEFVNVVEEGAAIGSPATVFQESLKRLQDDGRGESKSASGRPPQEDEGVATPGTPLEAAMSEVQGPSDEPDTSVENLDADAVSYTAASIAPPRPAPAAADDTAGAVLGMGSPSHSDEEITSSETRPLRGSAPNRHEKAAWRELAGREPALAYFHALLAEDESPLSVALPSSLVRAVCLAPYVRDIVGSVGEVVASDLASLDLSVVLNVPDDELQQALRLLVVAASLRPALLAPASAASAQLDSLRHDGGFGKLWEFCNEVVEFARGGLALGPDVLSIVSTTAAWEDRVGSVQREARVWLHQKAPAYRFSFVGATNVWRKMLERGNLLEQIMRPVVENHGSEVATVQQRIDSLSSPGEIHRQIQRIDRDQVGRPRGGDISSSALRQLDGNVFEALEIARRWVQLQRVNPAGGEGWRLQQAGKLRSTLKGLHDDVASELRMAGDRASGGTTQCMAGAVAVCAAAVEDLCGLFEEGSSKSGGDETASALLAVPLLLRPSAPIRPDGTVDLTRPAALKEALSQRLSNDSEGQWNAAFKERLARNDFIGTQLLLEKADRLGCHLDARERERYQELHNEALVARRTSLGYEIRIAGRNIAQGAALGFLREQEHNDLLAAVTHIEAALSLSLDFAGLERELRAVQAALSSSRQAAVAEVRTRLTESADVSAEMLQKIEALLDQGDVLTATEVLQNRTQWMSAQESDDSGTEQFSHFLAFLRRASNVPSAGASALAELDAPEGTDAPDAPESVTPDARTLLGAWTDRHLNQIDVGLPKRLFGLLGFTVESVDPVGGSGPRWQEVRVAAIRDRSRCPVPFFGSRAAGHYRVLWAWEPTSPEDIVSAVTEKDGSRDEAVIVFYFGRLDETQRRALRLASLQNRTRFLVIDDILLAYLTRLKGARMSAFFACALPFTNLVPYHTLAGEVPPEMFYGRYQQRRDIQDRDGTCLVYGGRQLGKTALLKDVQGSFSNRAEGRVAIYADLKAAGVGVQRNADAVWDVIADELRRAQIPVPDSNKRGTSPMNEVVEKAVQAWINKSPQTNRVLLLLDEADLFFKKDGDDHNFANAHSLKVLMDRTQRAFKVVFAGLHNVQRSTRIVNHPLAHLGVPVCVGPMVEGAEWRAAVELVERPLAAMGYEIDRDLTIRILSHTNYYPSLIQIYCGELLKHVNQTVNRYAAERGPLPVRITPAQVEDAYRSVELRQRIKQSFDLTLNLDPRYRVIALCVAYATSAREPWVQTIRDISVGELRAMVMAHWGGGFRHDPSEDGFRALLEEMVGLGVLRRSGESRYALRGANVPLLLGSEEEVFEKLTNLDPPDTYEIFEPDTYRRPIAQSTREPDRIGGRAALTTRQEFDLYSPTSGVALICGVPAAGLREVGRCLATGERVSVQPLPPDASEAEFQELLHEVLRKGALGATLLPISDSASWSETWVHHALDALRARRSQERFTKVVFIAGPEHTWSLLRDHGGRDQAIESLRTLGVTVHSLQPWRAAVVRHWLEEQQLSTTTSTFRLQEVAARTGYWPGVLADYVQTARGKGRGQIQDPGADYLASLVADGAADRWKAEFGLLVDEPTSVLEALSRVGRELDGPVPLEELVVLGDVDERLAISSLAWADTLGLVTIQARKSGPIAWALDPVVNTLLQAANPEAVSRLGSGSSPTLRRV